MSKVRIKKVKIVLEDIEQSMRYKFLETASDKKELIKIAKKRGLVVPSPDIALFKGTYTKADVYNANGSRLKKELIEGALDTLVLKPVTHNHAEKQIIGVWLDAKMDGDTVIAYGAFYKDNFADEYAQFKEDFEKGTVGISYELYGDQIMHNDGKYDWENIFFCGGALLNRGIPAAVKGSRVLEFARVKDIGANDIQMTTCDKCGFKFDASTVKPEENGGIKCPKCNEIIGLNQKTESTDEIPCNCPSCGNRTWDNVVDYKDKLIARCTTCQKTYEFEIEEYNKDLPKLGINLALEGNTTCPACQSNIKYPIWANREQTPLTCKVCGLRFIHKRKENKIKYIVKSIMEVKEEVMNELQKAFSSVQKDEDVTDEMIVMFESASEEDKDTLDSKIKEIAVKLLKKKNKKKNEEVECECIECGYSMKSKEHCEDLKCPKCDGQMRRKDRPGSGKAKKEISKDVLIAGIKKLALEIMNLREDVKVVSEYEQELASVKELKDKEISTIIKDAEDNIEKVKTEYKEIAKTIVSRREQLGDFAKELKDDELLNDKDFEIAKLKKEVAEMKDKKVTKEIASQENPDNIELGSKDDKVVDEDVKKVDEYNKKLEEAHKEEMKKRKI